MATLTLDAADAAKETEIVDAMETEMTNHIKTSEKYTQLKPVVDGNITKERHEYVCPDGTAGYQIILKTTKDAKEYVKTIGYGPEAESRTKDWTEVVEDEI